MKPKKRTEQQTRGWLPDEHPAVLAQKMSKPIWSKTLWIGIVFLTVVIFTVASGILVFSALHMILQQVTVGLVLGSICMGIAYYLRFKYSERALNRALYVFLGATPLGFCLNVAYVVFLGHYVTGWLMGWFNIIITVGILITGAFIGDWIGKRRNYQLPLSP
jgi:hypothetical protein